MRGGVYHISSMSSNTTRRSAGFTIVELIVVISIVAILAVITAVGYGAWQSSLKEDQVKNDLIAAAGTMEEARTFSDEYPLTLPASFTAGEGIEVVLSVPGTDAYCIDGGVAGDESIEFYIDDTMQSAAEGTCATRSETAVPGVVTNVILTLGSNDIQVSWTLASPNYATGYIVQCAEDQAFIVGLLEATVSGATTDVATVEGAKPLSTYHCRVRAVNDETLGAWSNTQSSNTAAPTCALTNQYGDYPDCYDYDSLPVGTSIAGYWSTAPDGYILEDGSAVSRTTYADLFNLIGTTYGSGDGSTTFNLPDSRGRATVNINSGDSEFNTIGEKYGEKDHTLTVSEMPSHSHAQYVTANSGGTSVRRDYSSDGSSSAYSQGHSTGGAGSGAAYSVIQPSIVKRYAIKYRAPTGTDSTLPAGTTLQGYWSSDQTGYAYENGAAVSRTTYSELYALTGTTYGVGDGSTTFNLPDSRGRVGVNRSPSDSSFGSLGQTSGQKTHTLTIAQMASHSHLQYVTALSGGSAIRNDYASDGNGGTYDQGQQTGGAGGGQAHNIIQPSITKRSTIKTAPAAAVQSDAGVRPGTSLEGWWTSVPDGFLAEDGSAVSRTTYADLFAVIGTTFGAGDGSTTFNLPDSRGRVAVNINPADSEFNSIGETFGSKTHIMTLAELPSHSHAQYVTANSGCCAIRRDYKSDASGGTYTQGLNGGGAGSSSPFNIIQPSITKMFVIKY